MDAFESLVTSLLERQGFWVRSSFKVELTKDEKKQIGRPSSPRWEIDLVAYKGGSNDLFAIECKSYLDSRGVSISAFNGTDESFAARFKLFTEPLLRKVVLNRLVQQLQGRKAIAKRPKVTLCLVAGKIVSEGDRAQIQDHFKKNGWLFWDDKWLRDSLKSAAEGGYENDIADVVAKLLLRGGDGGANSGVHPTPASGRG